MDDNKMETNDDTKLCPLTFLKNDWFEKGNTDVAVHLYVKSVTNCHINFKEDCCDIFFQSSDEQFLKIHGPKTEDDKFTFFYSIHPSGKIIPEKCVYSVLKTRVELKLVKAVPNHWVSLETRKAVEDRKKSSDSKSSISALNCSENGKKDHNSNQALSTSTNNVVSSGSLNIEDLSLKDSTKVNEVPLETSKNMYPRSKRSAENLMLLGGKSTPVSKKGSEQETKAEKEMATSSEPQASAVVRDSSSLKNVNKTSVAGLTGLENYANNCYMNVVIQVLANIPEIRDYFIDDHFVNCLNTSNPMSSGGRVAKAFAEVIKALWSERKKPVRPQDLKSIMGKRCSLFLGIQQCDAQEFFNTLLDNLHEDMNHGVRPEKSNEISHKDESSPSFSEKADTAWKEHIKRHNSLIVKMFHGQTVSTLTCQGCHKKSKTYEPCGQISLPIVMSRLRLQVTVFFRDNLRSPERLRLQISSPHAQVWHLLNILERHIGIPASCLRVCHENKGSLVPAFEDDFPLSSIRKQKQVIICEVKDDKETEFLSIPFKQHVSSSCKCSSCGRSQADLETKLKRCTRCMYVSYCSRDCQSKHWSTHQRDCRKGFRASIGLPFYVTVRKHKLNFETLSAAALHYASFSVGFSDKDSDSSEGETEDKKSSKQDAAAINLASKQPEKSMRTMCASDGEADERKQLSKSEDSSNGCSKTLDNTVKFRESEKDEKQARVEGASNLSTNSGNFMTIKAYLKAEQDPVLINADDFKIDTVLSAVYLAVEWPNDNIKEKDSLNASFRTVHGCPIDDNPLDGDRCSIEECFSLFLEPERLLEKEGWKCPKCKTVQAVKKEMALSYLPPILLVHFKRFTFATYSQKVTKGINYPTSGLELSHFIAEETKNLLSVHPVYDLIGVICHKGCMGIGHYTCMVRCFSQQGQPDIGWRHFDDDNVLKIDDDERVLDSSAYVLVYRLRGTSQALKTDSPFMDLPSQVNEGRHERLPATAKTLSRPLSTDNDPSVTNKSHEHSTVKTSTRFSDRKSEASNNGMGISGGYSSVSMEESNAFPYEKPMQEIFGVENIGGDFVFGNDDDSCFEELSRRRTCKADTEGGAFSTKTSEDILLPTVSKNIEKRIDDVPGKGSDGENFIRDMDEKSKEGERTGVERITKLPDDHEMFVEHPDLFSSEEEFFQATDDQESGDELFYLARNDLTEVTENDLD